MDDAEIRALNLAMAAVCGYPVLRSTEWCQATPYLLTWPSGYLGLMRESWGTSEPWSPVTNPAQALEVAEALAKKDWNVSIDIYASGTRACELRYTGLDHVHGGKYSHRRTARTVAEVICLAAAEMLEREAGGGGACID